MKNRYVQVMIVIFIGIFVGLGVANENVILVILALTVGSLFKYSYMKKLRTRETIEDERTYLIAEKAARFSIFIFILPASFLCIILITLRNEYPDLSIAGFTLAYSVLAIMGAYYTFYGYFNRIYGYT